MVTLKDVGELAGVTATTASAALRGKDYVKPETTQRVRDAARKLGYKINLSGDTEAFTQIFIKNKSM